ncbi:hypothetical protein [Lentzea sp. NPDC059081]|uniref:hypothetical protein n=1 Tax=Lentzea sp. NPDC059081 TaxID=3346719 RepID=UPI003678F227
MSDTPRDHALGTVADHLASVRLGHPERVAVNGFHHPARARRYHAASRRYLDEVGPAGRATVVLDNTDLAHPSPTRLDRSVHYG